MWAAAQLCFFLVLVGIIMNLLGFPAKVRLRIYVGTLLTFMSQPSWSQSGQHWGEVLLSFVALLSGELFGNVLNRALFRGFRSLVGEIFLLADEFSRSAKEQARRVEQLECEKERVEYDLRFSQQRLARASATPSANNQFRPITTAGSTAASWDGLPSEVVRGLVADGLMRDDSAAAPTAATGGFRVEGERTLGPVSNLSGCGCSTLGSSSEIGGSADLGDPQEGDDMPASGGAPALLPTSRVTLRMRR